MSTALLGISPNFHHSRGSKSTFLFCLTLPKVHDMGYTTKRDFSFMAASVIMLAVDQKEPNTSSATIHWKYLAVLTLARKSVFIGDLEAAYVVVEPSSRPLDVGAQILVLKTDDRGVNNRTVRTTYLKLSVNHCHQYNSPVDGCPISRELYNSEIELNNCHITNFTVAHSSALEPWKEDEVRPVPRRDLRACKLAGPQTLNGDEGEMVN
ncbi:hypothetical protein BKA70DRAFT_1218361 [Coprinopsis sp. MPI-PUGE-AT-0042]|nr:hypothetical protein BKA70DRAFT_1218361 [Coprinopsis sp. MPI-PUGE-AT-0042]